MPNTFITPSIVAQEALMILSNELVVANTVYRGYESEYTNAKVGDTIKIRRPAAFDTNEFTSSVTVQAATEGYTQIQLEKHFDVTFELGPKDLTLNIEDFSRQLVAPAMVSLAEKIDSYIFSKIATQAYNFVGTAGSTPSTVDDLAGYDRRLNEQKCPTRNRVAFVTPRMKQKILGIPTINQVNTSGSTQALRDAAIGRIMGFDFYMSQGINVHTSGTASASNSLLTNGALAAGAQTLAMDGGSGSATLLEGDLFTIAGVYLPGSANVLMHFRVTANNTASAGAWTGVAFEPALPTSVADNTAITVIASHEANAVFHPNGVALVSVPLELPLGVPADKAAQINYGGVSIRVVYGYDLASKKDTISFDTLVGAKVVDNRLVARLLG